MNEAERDPPGIGCDHAVVSRENHALNPANWVAQAVRQITSGVDTLGPEVLVIHTGWRGKMTQEPVGVPDRDSHVPGPPEQFVLLHGVVDPHVAVKFGLDAGLPPGGVP